MNTSAAAASSVLKANSERIGSSATGRREEARQNTVSPSNIEWTGRMARAIPSCATAASLLAWALRQGRIGQDHADRGGERRLRLGVGSRQRLALGIESALASSCIRSAHSRPVAGSTADPAAFTTTAAATETPEASSVLGVAEAPLMPPQTAPVPAANRAGRRLVAGGRSQRQRSEV